MEKYSAIDYLLNRKPPECLKHLKISVLDFDDVGMVGLYQEQVYPAHPSDEEKARMSELGLPATFRTRKKPNSFKKQRTSSWVEEKDPESGYCYYHNSETGDIQWDKPEELEEKDERIKLRKDFGRKPFFKYWLQRYSLFSRFDEGIEVDEESWYSITPECIAKHHALKEKGWIVLDAFCGVGGNAIQFALAGKIVIGVDKEMERIQMAKRNAQIYSVGDRIEFVVGDLFAVGDRLSPDSMFVSPPWGGPEYLRGEYVQLDFTSDLGRYVMRTINLARKISCRNLMLFLPRNIDLNDLVVEGFEICEVEVMRINGRLKAITIYGQVTT